MAAKRAELYTSSTGHLNELKFHLCHYNEIIIIAISNTNLVLNREEQYIISFYDFIFIYSETMKRLFVNGSE